MIRYANQWVKHHVHLVVTILSDSLMNGQVAEFVRYNVPADVCTASYSQDGSMANFKGHGTRGGTRPETAYLN